MKTIPFRSAIPTVPHPVSSSHSATESWHHIPVSQLLQIERHRGFDSDQRHGRQLYHQWQQSRLSTSQSNCPASSSTMKPPCRTFSTQRCSLQQPTVRRPPPLPTRSPKLQLRPEPEPEPEVVILTGKELARQHRVERGRALGEKLELQARLERVEAVVVRAAKYGLNEFPRPAQQVIQQIREDAEINGRKRFRAYLEERQKEIARLQQDLDVDILYNKAFKSLIHQQLKAAREQAKADFARDLAWTKYHAQRWLPFETRVEELENTLRSLQLEKRIKKLHYAIQWWAWRAAVLDLQAEEVDQFVIPLKDESGLHHALNSHLQHAGDASQLIANLILDKELQDLADVTYRFEDTRPASQIAKSWLQFINFATCHAPLGHIYRKINRIYQVMLRFPESVAHEEITLKIDLWHQDARSLADETNLFVDDFLTSSPTKLLKQLPKWKSVQSSLKRYGKALTTLNYNLLLALNHGFMMHNPGLASSYGMRLYAIFHPFASFLESQLSATASLEHLFNDDPKSLTPRLQQVQAPFQNMITTRRRDRRAIISELATLQVYVAANLLKNDDVPFNLKRTDLTYRDRRSIRRSRIFHDSIEPAVLQRQQNFDLPFINVVQQIETGSVKVSPSAQPSKSARITQESKHEKITVDQRPSKNRERKRRRKAAQSSTLMHKEPRAATVLHKTGSESSIEEKWIAVLQQAKPEQTGESIHSMSGKAARVTDATDRASTLTDLAKRSLQLPQTRSENPAKVAKQKRTVENKRLLVRRYLSAKSKTASESLSKSASKKANSELRKVSITPHPRKVKSGISRSVSRKTEEDLAPLITTPSKQNSTCPSP